MSDKGHLEFGSKFKALATSSDKPAVDPRNRAINVIAATLEPGPIGVAGGPAGALAATVVAIELTERLEKAGLAIVPIEKLRAICARISQDGDFSISVHEFADLISLCCPPGIRTTRLIPDETLAPGDHVTLNERGRLVKATPESGSIGALPASAVILPDGSIELPAWVAAELLA